MISIKDLNYNQLERWVKDQGWKKFRAKQIAKWIYNKKVNSYDEMTDLSKEVRNYLKENTKLNVLELVTFERSSQDGSIKFLWRLEDGHTVESVFIPERGHNTLCVSTQVGCAVGCKFCFTTKDGLIRNLTTAEIVDQYIQSQIFVGPENRISNVVYMGMGEPLANYENVKRSVQILTDDRMLGLSNRKITISSSGIIHQIKKMYDDPSFPQVRLAVSLNASDQKTRERIMPISETNSLEDLMKTLNRLPVKTGFRIMLEYVLIKDINDRPEDAHRLARLIGKNKKRYKVNLIPFNPYPGSDFERPEKERVDQFHKILWQYNIGAFVRWSKGSDISAACGQLRKKEVQNLIKIS
ncbi:MAG TPA: 23S rRNA (adenine(2503)-C(2))-methyltransferase RlmN [Persephonella sp.]|uniref:Probable dual-specificity RNA methyltransferase RlmN n=1 Tax=Persephonella marina (strain DSM 14350 / EX-H1) TaxID=123214 RepID=C0QUJ8_PERMH|nr:MULTISPECIES: 23S rRNA (adenine(2503)-C(2))-methyltransferase RlmN [Persephonella]ACO03007.1 radical SAM enzyme, Cfr family [Persephonella marina EX-H1]HCB70020.1 23S rRNA (adenine(2503)-C(2))-methyltransferase RlmN [Persephonella sp.]